MSVPELHLCFDAHRFETGQDRCINGQANPGKQVLDSGILYLPISEGVYRYTTIREGTTKCVLKTKFSCEPILWEWSVDISHHRGCQSDIMDLFVVWDFWEQLKSGGYAEMRTELARKHLECEAGLDNPKGQTEFQQLTGLEILA